MVAINILDFLDFYRSLFPFPHKITFLGDQNANNQEENIFIGAGIRFFYFRFCPANISFSFLYGRRPAEIKSIKAITSIKIFTNGGSKVEERKETAPTSYYFL